MGRWAYLDSDEERLPAGMVRIGYDADTQTYSYRDSDGSTWEGAPGNTYGKMFKVSSPSRTSRPKAVSAPAAPKPRFDWTRTREDEKRVPLPDDDCSDTATLTHYTDSTINDTNSSSLMDKPLPPLPDIHPALRDDDFKAPKGEEHRYKRRQSRDEQSLQRRSTVSRITNYLRRNGSIASRMSEASGSTRLSRASTVRVTEAENRAPRRGQATTFEEILGPHGNIKE